MNPAESVRVCQHLTSPCGLRKGYLCAGDKVVACGPVHIAQQPVQECDKPWICTYTGCTETPGECGKEPKACEKDLYLANKAEQSFSQPRGRRT
jgi:hypothetical protein